MEFRILLEPQEEGGFTARCVEIPGAISQGETEEEALGNVRDALSEILEVRMEQAGKRRRANARLRTVKVHA